MSQPSGAVSGPSPAGPPATPAPPHRPTLATFVRLARPKQWLKNVLVVAAPGAAGVLNEPLALFQTGVAFVSFCLAASGTYFLNDVIDRDADRLHPKKRLRPVAASEVSVRAAITGGVVLLVAAIGCSFLARPALAIVVGSYIAVTIAYSLWLKNEPVLDLATVAAGFVLRAIAGGIAVGVPISPWFLIVAAAGSLFMVTGKRHAEMIELGADAGGHREPLNRYSRTYLAYVRAVASAVAIMAYCLWAFEKAYGGGFAVGPGSGEKTASPVWFELSIVPFVLAILRYALLLEQGRGGAPEDLVLSDRVLLVLGVVWVIVFATAVHFA